jgi:hypothetical protein
MYGSPVPLLKRLINASLLHKLYKTVQTAQETETLQQKWTQPCLKGIIIRATKCRNILTTKGPATAAAAAAAALGAFQ